MSRISFEVSSLKLWMGFNACIDGSIGVLTHHKYILRLLSCLFKVMFSTSTVVLVTVYESCQLQKTWNKVCRLLSALPITLLVCTLFVLSFCTSWSIDVLATLLSATSRIIYSYQFFSLLLVEMAEVSKVNNKILRNVLLTDQRVSPNSASADIEE